MGYNILEISRKAGILFICLLPFLFSGCEKEEIPEDSISIYLPSAGVVYLRNTPCTILWASSGPEYVNIDLYKGPDTVRHIARDLINNGSFKWKIPGDISTGRNYYFKISDSDDPEKTFDETRSFGIIPQSETSFFQDSRDDQRYKTVKIGKQWWMAENFRFNATEGAYSYAGVESNSIVYGRLYKQQFAIENAPEGWHLPSDDEWKELEAYLGLGDAELDLFGTRGLATGTLLMEGGGTGFDALFGGYHNICVDYYAHMLWEGHYWTSSRANDNKPIIRILADGRGGIMRLNSICHDMCSVRYIKD